eukprot:1064214_1
MAWRRFFIFVLYFVCNYAVHPDYPNGFPVWDPRRYQMTSTPCNVHAADEIDYNEFLEWNEEYDLGIQDVDDNNKENNVFVDDYSIKYDYQIPNHNIEPSAFRERIRNNYTKQFITRNNSLLDEGN